ncbi:hypothetical protein WMY93_007790 [Mugilogobius chulae]|uniref:Ig-like domain-containing protein n=1 Tax=Mugilogobius chulae TaxID=88201 RepID=A0AAW0PHN8_9GOBI
MSSFLWLLIDPGTITPMAFNSPVQLGDLGLKHGLWAQIVIPQSKVEVIKGQKVVLLATYRNPSNSDPSTNTVLWNFVSESTTHLIISYTSGSVNMDSSAQFKNRVGFADPNLGRTSHCTSTTLWSRTQGATSAKSSSPTVQVSPPSLLWTSKSLQLYPSVLCPCWKANPVYKWKKTSPTSEVFFSPMLDEKTGTLKLANLSSSMSGKYVCTATNDAGSESCFINLEVISSTNAGMIVGAVVGSVVGFLLLLLLCIFYLLKRRRDNEDDMANEIKEDAQAPKRVSWAKSNMGSDIISKNGTLSSIASSPRHKEPSHHHHHDNNHHQNHHHQLQQYPQRAASDTASIVTATGSMAATDPPGNTAPPPHAHPLRLQPHLHPSMGQAAEAQPERYGHLPQAQAVPQAYTRAPSPPPLPASTVTHANIARMGGVPIMVPAQNQAGSLV